jgi:hypothetical protein
MSNLDDNSAEKIDDLTNNNNNLLGIDDIITNATDNIINISNSPTSKDNENYSNDKNFNKSNENEPLSKKNYSSEVIQIPEIKNNDELNENTLNESIITTIYRDLFLIYTKLKFVIMPYAEKEKKNFHIKQWDLWGPLILDMFLSCTLAVNSKEKSNMIILIFVIFWLGGVILYLNANFLGVKSSIFQMFCLLGYCLFPLNISAIFVTIFRITGLFRLIIVGITTLWSIYSSSDFLKSITNQDQRYLVLYPCILFYLYISWFIVSTKS